MYQENPEKDFFDEVMDLIGSDSKDSAVAAVRFAPPTCFVYFFADKPLHQSATVAADE